MTFADLAGGERLFLDANRWSTTLRAAHPSWGRHVRSYSGASRTKN